MIVLRSDHPVSDEIREKIALFTDVATRGGHPGRDGRHDLRSAADVRGGRPGPADRPRARADDADVEPDLDSWRALVARIKAPKPVLEIALVGKYIELPDAYLSVTEALRHAAWAHEVDAKVRWVDSEKLTADNVAAAARGRGRRARPGRLRPPRHRGQGPRRALRPRAAACRISGCAWGCSAR